MTFISNKFSQLFKIISQHNTVRNNHESISTLFQSIYNPFHKQTFSARSVDFKIIL